MSKLFNEPYQSKTESKTSPAPNVVTPKRFSVYPSHPYQRQIPKTARPISPSTIQIRNLQAQLEKANERIQETTNRAVLAETQVGQLEHNLEIANNQNEVLTKKNAILSNQVKEFRDKQNSVNRSLKQKEKREMVKEAKKKRQFDDFSDTQKRRIITNKWNNLVEDYGGEKSAKEIVNKLYNKYVDTQKLP